MRSELQFEAILVAMAAYNVLPRIDVAVLYLQYFALWVCQILLEYLTEWCKVKV